MILNILTTATPREQLHRQTLEPWIRELYKSKIFDQIRWFVNLDKPAVCSAKEFLLTKKYLHSNYYFIPVIYTECLENPTFSNAARKVYNRCNVNLNRDKKNYFLWLEDDWKIDSMSDAINDIKEFVSSEKEILSFANLPRITGWPVIFTDKLFDEVTKRLNYSKIDPEVAMMLSVYDIYDMQQKDYPRDSLPENILYRSSENRCFDMGRDWRISKKIIKTVKSNVNQSTWKLLNE